MNGYNRKVLLFTAGLIFIVFSLGFFPYRIESAFTKFVTFREKIKESGVRTEDLRKKTQQLKEDILDLNQGVGDLSGQINTLITTANTLTDSVANWVSNGVNDKVNLKDSLSLLESSLDDNERSVDSLNGLFTVQSDLLIKQMSKYDEQNIKIKLNQIHTDALKQQMVFLTGILFAQAFFLLTCLVFGIIFLVRSLTKK